MTQLILNWQKILAPALVLSILLCGGATRSSAQQTFSEEGVLSYYNRQDWTGMKNYCEQWLRVAPNDWGANDYMGCAYYQSKMYGASIPYFKKAIEVRPSFAFTYKQLALSEGYNDRFDLMLNVMHLGEKTASQTFDYQMWRWYGAWYEKWNDDDSAIHAWQQAYDMQASAQAKSELGQAYYHKGRNEAFAQKLDQSESDLKKAIALGDPKAKEYLEVVQKYHYVDKPKWQAEATRNYNAWCAEQRKIVATERPTHMIDFGQLEFRRQTYQNAHPDSPDKHGSY